MSDDEDNSKKSSVARVLPVQHPSPFVQKKNSHTTPRQAQVDAAYAARMLALQEEYIDSDDLVKVATDATADRPELLMRMVRGKLARASAMLDFERIELQKKGKSTEAMTVASKHIAALEKVLNTEIEISKRKSGKIDVRGPLMAKIVALWIQKVQETVSSLPAEFQPLFFSKFHEVMQGWEDEVERVVDPNNNG